MPEVLDLEQARIARALAARSRYRYVQPRIERDGRGWRIVSPNCSRNVDPEGGEIEIARLEPGRRDWQLLWRDHARREWKPHSRGSLAALLAVLAQDPSREFWP